MKDGTTHDVEEVVCGGFHGGARKSDAGEVAQAVFRGAEVDGAAILTKQEAFIDAFKNLVARLVNYRHDGHPSNCHSLESLDKLYARGRAKKSERKKEKGGNEEKEIGD